MIKKLCCLIGNVVVVSNIYADTTYVFCADENRKWEWLKENGNYVSVNGKWKKKYQDETYYKYFQLENNIKVEYFVNKCKQKFGESFIYAQPANNRGSEWAIFGQSENNLSCGIVEMIGKFFNKGYHYIQCNK